MKKLVGPDKFKSGRSYMTSSGTIFKIIRIEGDKLIYYYPHHKLNNVSEFTTTISQNMGHKFSDLGISIKFGK